jgi:hypothetical protein
MRLLLKDLRQWGSLVISNWLYYAAAGLTALVWAIGERVERKPFSWHVLEAAGLVFLVFAFFNVWRAERAEANHHRETATSREREIEELKKNANSATASTADPALELLRERQRLEAEVQPLLEIEERGIKVVPTIKIGKDESDYRKERIERIKRDIEQIERRLEGLGEATPVDWSFATEWRNLSAKFQELPGRIKAEWDHRSYRPDEWRIAHPGCAALCRLAGAMLVKSPKISAALSQELRSESDSMFRWLTFLKEKNQVTGILEAYETATDGGQKLILSGYLENVGGISSSMCIDCAAREL